MLLQVEILDAVELSVDDGALLARGDSGLFIAVGVLVDLNKLADESALGVSGVNTSVEGLVGLEVAEGVASEDTVVSERVARSREVEHIFIYNIYKRN